ncbi:TPA: glycosyltransferase family 2 protein [Vibrio vulnificus]|nr:glycosyltransferase [Vibrio vulnificus]HDY8185970.1 glycosyltransferase family 2 protein [Vibrio vulnificus]
MNCNLTVSVIIPSYNSENFIRESVESVLSQTYPIDEIIVIDDGSTDGSSALLLDLERNNENVRVVTTSNNGASSARNTGLKLAKSDIVAFLDSDDYWVDNKIETQIKYLLENNYQALVSSLNIVDKNSKLISHQDNYGNDLIHKILRKKVSMMTPTLIFYKSLVEENNLSFNVNMKHYEDHLFIISLASRGRLGAMRERLVNRRVHDLSSSSVFNIENCLKSVSVFEKELNKIKATTEGLCTRDINYFKSHAYFSIAHLLFRKKNRLASLRYLFRSISIRPSFKSIVLMFLCVLPFSNVIFNKISSQEVSD